MSRVVSPWAEETVGRYEPGWQALRQGNESVCDRARDVAAAVTGAATRAEVAVAGWERLQSELRTLPATMRLMDEVSAGVREACERFEVLERRLVDATVARTEQREVRWRQQQLLDLEAEEERSAAEAEAARVAAEEQAAQRERLVMEERRQTFHEQFEADRVSMLEHGNIGTPLRRGATAPQHAAGEPEAPLTLAEVGPALAADDDLDAFYAD